MDVKNKDNHNCCSACNEPRWRSSVRHAAGRNAQDAKQSQSNSASTSTPTHSDEKSVGGGVRVLAESAQSRVDDAFVAVARDAETYTALRELAGQLPELNADFFTTNALSQSGNRLSYRDGGLTRKEESSRWFGFGQDSSALCY